MRCGGCSKARRVEAFPPGGTLGFAMKAESVGSKGSNGLRRE